MAEPLIKTAYNPAIENPEKAREIEQDNKEYKEPLKVTLEEQKRKLKEELYWVKEKDIIHQEMIDMETNPNEQETKRDAFEEYSRWPDYYKNTWVEVDEDNISEVQEWNDFWATWIPEWTQVESIEDRTIPDNISKKKEYPLIEKFLDKKWIYISNFKLNKDWNIDIYAIEWLEIKDRIELEWLINNLNESNQDANILDFAKVIKEVEILKNENTSMDNDWHFEEAILNLIGEKYLSIPENTIEENISLAIELKRNGILSDVKNLKIDTQTYKTAIENINSENLEKQIRWLKSLHILAYSGEWKYWKKQIELYKYVSERQIQLEEKYSQLQNKLKLAKEKWETEKASKIEDEIKAIENEAIEIESWDIFEAWETDKWPEKIESETQA